MSNLGWPSATPPEFGAPDLRCFVKFTCIFDESKIEEDILNASKINKDFFDESCTILMCQK